ncbi:unnamed protein product [Candidula unifasciata]|uniref:Uncharacterized protein n=1 Tax=Candidula unifasciata TaxID=100452 RepID=A0A8S3YJ57_9EUPU|nr:unnamed protein product [Candidula unifasciata]
MAAFADESNGHSPALADPKLKGKDKLNGSTSGKTQLAAWILIWFYITAIICTWDATFIMMRPYSLPGGSLASLWYLYKYYVTVDQRYMDTSDAFVFAQSLLNYVEVVFNIITIYMHYRSSRHTPTLAFTVSVMTMWKTVLYFLMFSELCTGGQYRTGNTFLQELFLVVIPNIIWIVVPLCVMYSLWKQLTPAETRQAVPARGQGFHDNSLVDSGYSLRGKPASNGSANGTSAVKRSVK